MIDFIVFYENDFEFFVESYVFLIIFVCNCLFFKYLCKQDEFVFFFNKYDKYHFIT